MQVSKLEDRNFILDWIESYRELPALWKVDSKEYRDRNQKNVAYDVLLAKYQEKYPAATKEDVKRKINSLRTNYRKELKKTRDSAQTCDMYESTLWYFDSMSFLEDQEPPVTMVGVEFDQEDTVSIM